MHTRNCPVCLLAQQCLLDWQGFSSAGVVNILAQVLKRVTFSCEDVGEPANRTRKGEETRVVLGQTYLEQAKLQWCWQHLRYFHWTWLVAGQVWESMMGQSHACAFSYNAGPSITAFASAVSSEGLNIAFACTAWPFKGSPFMQKGYSRNVHILQVLFKYYARYADFE